MSRNGYKRQHTSMRGEVVDMDAMRASNESQVAVGNARMNARGDVLNRHGEIEVRREQIAREYYDRGGPQASQSVSLKPAVPDVFETPEEVMARINAAKTPATPAAPTGETDEPEGLSSRRSRKLVDKGDD